VASKLALVDDLASANEALRARERVLSRAVEKGEGELRELEARFAGAGDGSDGDGGDEAEDGVPGSSGGARGGAAEAAAGGAAPAESGVAGGVGGPGAGPEGSGSSGPPASGDSLSSAGGAAAAAEGLAPGALPGLLDRGGLGAGFEESLGRFVAAVMRAPLNQELPKATILTGVIAYRDALDMATRVQRGRLGAPGAGSVRAGRAAPRLLQPALDSRRAVTPLYPSG
jgi:hypothetical protein